MKPSFFNVLKNLNILNNKLFLILGFWKVKTAFCEKRNFAYTVGIRLSDTSGNRMVNMCPIAEWSVNWMPFS